jgi:hypothetical protein
MRIAAFLPALLAAPLLAAPEPPPPVPTVKLTLHPAAEPQPALKYTLLPEVKELEAGNAATVYFRVLGGEINFLMQPGVAVQIDGWLKTPLKDLPRAEVRAMVAGTTLRDLDVASRQDHCDWNFLAKLRRGGYFTLLGEIQKLRQIPQWIGARARLEMADGKPTEAIESIKTILALGHHLGDYPSVISNLVGIAIAQIGLNQVEELVQLPNAPNLYWALANLPTPLVSMRRGVESEKLCLQVEFEGLLASADTPLTPAQIQRIVEKLDRLRQSSVEEANQPPLAPAKQVLESLTAQELPAARKHLIDQGHSAAHVESLPPAQAVLLYELFKHNTAQDNASKLVGLPYWQANDGLNAFEALIKQQKARSDQGLFSPLWLSVNRTRQAQARLDRRIAALRVVEAVRLYAAAHAGKLPPALKDLPVPVPTDPMTGRDFDYRLDGDRAFLEGLLPPGADPVRALAFRYELTIEK